jgi:zinc and cadmium transporter
MPVVYATAAVALVSVVSFSGVAALTLSDRALRRMVFVLVALAVGTLLGNAFLHLIPEVLESGVGTVAAGTAVFVGVLVFFMLEKFLAWHHHHGVHEESRETLAAHDHTPTAIAPLILTADFVHNMVDGVIIGASFLISPAVGVATTAAVVLHEIPQEIADFGLLIHAGWSRGKALLWNFFSALSAFIGLALVFIIGARAEGFIPLAAAFTAGAFLYIAGTDLVPELHKTSGSGRAVIQVFALIAGFGLMLALIVFE